MYASRLHLFCRVNVDVLRAIALFRVVELACFYENNGVTGGQRCGPGQQLNVEKSEPHQFFPSVMDEDTPHMHLPRAH